MNSTAMEEFTTKLIKIIKEQPSHYVETQKQACKKQGCECAEDYPDGIRKTAPIFEKKITTCKECFKVPRRREISKVTVKGQKEIHILVDKYAHLEKETRKIKKETETNSSQT